MRTDVLMIASEKSTAFQLHFQEAIIVENSGGTNSNPTPAYAFTNLRSIHFNIAETFNHFLRGFYSVLACIRV